MCTHLLTGIVLLRTTSLILSLFQALFISPVRKLQIPTLLTLAWLKAVLMSRHYLQSETNSEGGYGTQGSQWSCIRKNWLLRERKLSGRAACSQCSKLQGFNSPRHHSCWVALLVMQVADYVNHVPTRTIKIFLPFLGKRHSSVCVWVFWQKLAKTVKSHPKWNASNWWPSLRRKWEENLSSSSIWTTDGIRQATFNFQPCLPLPICIPLPPVSHSSPNASQPPQPVSCFSPCLSHHDRLQQNKIKLSFPYF